MAGIQATERAHHDAGAVHRAGAGRRPALHPPALRALLRGQSRRLAAALRPHGRPRGSATPTPASSRASTISASTRTRVPRLEDVNRFLSPLTGFQAKPVSGYVPAFLFFDCLRNREFPTTITIRDGDHARLPARARHLPRHRRPRADAHRPGVRRHAGAVRRLRPHGGRDRARASRTRTSRSGASTSIIKAMARFFWFTIEFGLMRSAGRDSRSTAAACSAPTARSSTAIESPEVQRYPIQLEWVINQYFEIDHYQPLLFIVDSFDHLFELVDELERWMRDGQAGQRRARRAGRQRAGSAKLSGGVAGQVGPLDTLRARADIARRIAGVIQW